MLHTMCMYQDLLITRERERFISLPNVAVVVKKRRISSCWIKTYLFANFGICSGWLHWVVNLVIVTALLTGEALPLTGTVERLFGCEITSDSWKASKSNSPDIEKSAHFSNVLHKFDE